jgi:SIR2-like protein
MLRTDLIDVVNSGRAWAFLGSGASVDAGGATWRQLVERIVARSAEGERAAIAADALFGKALREKSYPKALSRIEHAIGRVELERLARETLNVKLEAGGLVRRIAEWPFAAYITGNYEDLLEQRLNAGPDIGWVPIGNSAVEIAKVSGDATRIVWHPHGAFALSEAQSHLILTEEDYDELYLEDSPVTRQLRAVLMQRRLVFFGFSFGDEEFRRVIKQVGRLADPTRPIFAFVGDTDLDEADRDELLKKYNVDVIPYRVEGGSHKRLAHLLDTYSAFVLRRSQRFRRPARPCPSYHPETTGLLLYNELLLDKRASDLDSDVFDLLLQARVLALLKHRGSQDETTLAEDAIARLPGSPTDTGTRMHEIERALAYLVARRLVERANGDLRLTQAGEDRVSEQSGNAERLADQFRASLLARARVLIDSPEGAQTRVAGAAEAFIKEAVNRRSLGVAMTFALRRQSFQEFHIVALLQSLPGFMEQLDSDNEALALSQLVRDLLAEPTEPEATYIGLALQSIFGVHLLSIDPDTVRVRQKELAESAFMLDASALIPYLARSSVGHAAAVRLIQSLVRMSACVFTTPLFAVEVAEHARWGGRHANSAVGDATTRLLATATGRAGESSNAFIEGFLAEVANGKFSATAFLQYLRDVLILQPKAMGATDDDVIRVLALKDVPTFDLGDWEGFTDTLLVERDELAEEIAERRRERMSYTHERQVQAEAEALIAIRNLRSGEFTRDEVDASNAYFISNTRAIDEVQPGLPVTMRLEAALHWVSTLEPPDSGELALFTSALLSELEIRNLQIVNERKLVTAFSPLIEASEAALPDALARHRQLVGDRYGADAQEAFGVVGPLYAPIVLESTNAQRADMLEQALAEERARSDAVAANARMTQKERDQLTQLQAKDKLRAVAGRASKRAAKSRPRRRRRRG